MRRGAWLVGLAVAFAAPARADDAAGDRKTAERYFRAGERAYQAQNFGAAAQNFEEAYKALPLADIAFGAAQAYRRHYRVEPKLEYAKRAVELYRVYLDQVKTGGRVGNAADYIGEMQREVDKLAAAGARAKADANAERTRLGVSPSLSNEKRVDGGIREIAELPAPEDIKIVATIDGKPVPPFEMVDVEPGPHVVRVDVAGFVPHESTERVVKGASTVAEIVLTPRPARVTIETERGARVRVDGRGVGTAPLATLDLPAGKHLIGVFRTGREALARDIEVARGQELRFDAPLEKTSRRRAVPFVATAAGGLGVFALSSVVYGIVEHSRANDQLAAIEAGDQRPAAADRYDGLISRRDTAFAASMIGGGAALAVGATAAALYWLDRPSEDARASPAIAASGAGIAITGRF